VKNLVHSAIFTGIAILVVCGGLSTATAMNAKQTLDTQNLALSADRDALANEKGVILQEAAIHKQISILDLRTGVHAKRVMLDRARAQRGITVKEFTLDPAGTQFSMKLSGTYSDIISATVAIPAQSPGASVGGLRIDADPDAGVDRATATLTGSFSS
jgi:hypothetical protein